MSSPLPAGVLAMAARGPAWAAWVSQLPKLTRELLDEWGLRPDGGARHGHCSLVLPVVADGGGRPAVLKVGFPEAETAHEHLALRHWQGRGAVRLLAADPHRRALLLERLHAEDLTSIDDDEACAVLAAAYGRLHVAAPPPLRRLTAELDRWRGQLLAVPRSAPVPHRLVEQSAAVVRALAEDPDTDGRLVHGDLHHGNVLAADREPWLVIDPKPLSGDPHLEPAPALWNRWADVVASGDVRGAVRRRFHALVDGALLDERRARDWVVLRTTLNAVWELHEPRPDRELVTRWVTVAKAVQD